MDEVYYRNYDALAIIGNGFDLQHGYNTRYKDFVDFNDSSDLKSFKDLYFKYNKQLTKVDTWYNFEENICELSKVVYQSCLNSGFHTNEMEILNNVFRKIITELEKYLNIEYHSREERVLPNVREYLNPKVFCINFNYTDTIKRYGVDNYHIHGSLSEHNIVLGFDFREATCLENFDDMRWNKDDNRLIIEYSRYINKIHIDNKEAYIDEMIRHIAAGWENRGLDDEVLSKFKTLSTINEFLDIYNKNNGIPPVDYKNIKNIYIMGHGIKADEKLLSNIFNSCNSLENIIVFCYKDSEFIEKKDMILMLLDNKKVNFIKERY